MLLTDRPTAVLGVNDLTALGAPRAARTLNMRVPDELSIVGFDGIELDDLVFPSPTTMSVSRKLIAHSCHSALEEMRLGRSARGQQLYIPVELIVRHSTGRPPRSAKRPRGRSGG